MHHPCKSTIFVSGWTTSTKLLFSLSTSAPVQNITQPVVLPVFAAAPANSSLNPQRQEQNWFHPPSTLAEISCRRPVFAPRAQPQAELENTFAWLFHPRPRLPSWRAREIERQREMDRIAEPYITRLREVARQKKVDAEARALTGQQRTDRAKEEPENPLKRFFEEDEKKAQKELKEVERQQRSEEKRQARKDAREERRRRKSVENTPPEVRETEARRKNSGRSKPYSIPRPATRSPRRSHVMPGGFDSDDLTSDQTGLTSDALWKGLKSAVDVGYRLWTQD